MSHTPIGYRISNGRPVIDDEMGLRIKDLFLNYVDGMALTSAAKAAGLDITHSHVSKIIGNRTYLGNNNYPMLIDPELFDRAGKEKEKRAKALGRVYEVKARETLPVKTNFRLGQIPKQYEDPFEQAAFAYSLIEEEING